MALVVEDGTGLADANSYISVADADTYHSDRGHTDWTAAAAEEKEQALILATQYLDGRYRKRWKGYKSTTGQALSWPRLNVRDEDGYSLDGTIPARLTYATAEAALAQIKGTELSPELERGGQVRRERVGSLETEYSPGAPARTALTAVSDLLRGLIIGGSGAVRITR
jgi:hypothetical protein